MIRFSPLFSERVRSEPYRALFPLGILLALLGIGVWIPHYLWPDRFGYPGQAHAVIQIQGFLLSFILGFLGTMVPKVLGLKPWGMVQFLFMPLGLSALTFAALAQAPVIAQALHLALIGNFLLYLARHWRGRRSSPPVFFVFIAAGVLADIFGTLARLATLTGYGSMPSLPLYRFGSLMQYQAFPLLLILGVGSFLLPKLFAHAPLDPARLQPAFVPLRVMVVAASLFMAGFAVEAWVPVHPAAVQAGSGLRAAVWGWFLFGSLRLHQVPRGLPAYLAGARLSLYAIFAGMLLPILLPRYIMAWEHLVFITGMLWLTVSIAARVVAAHGGALAMLGETRRTALAYGWLLAVAALTRVTTDIWTGARGFHLALAALLALIALGLWLRLYARLFFRWPTNASP